MRFACAAVLAMLSTVAAAQQQKAMLVVHGGAGTITRKTMTAEAEQQYRSALEQALKTGYGIRRGVGPGSRKE